MQRPPQPRAAGNAVSPAADAAASLASPRPCPLRLHVGNNMVALGTSRGEQDEGRDEAEHEHLASPLAEVLQDGNAPQGAWRCRGRARPRPTAPSPIPMSRTNTLVITVAREAIQGGEVRGATEATAIIDHALAARPRPIARPRAAGQAAADTAAGATRSPWAQSPRGAMGVQERAQLMVRACVMGATPHNPTVDWSVDLPTHTRRMSAHGVASDYGRGRKQQGAVRPHVQLPLTPTISASHASRQPHLSPVVGPRQSRP
jgi:hypothetical protein